MFNQPRRPYYDWSSNEGERRQQTSEAPIIENKRFWKLWHQLRKAREEAAPKKETASSKR